MSESGSEIYDVNTTQVSLTPALQALRIMGVDLGNYRREYGDDESRRSLSAPVRVAVPHRPDWSSDAS